MKNKTTRFLIISLIPVFALCIIVFVFIASYMNKESTKAINKVGDIYMSSMGEQISMHFETTINLRLKQINTIMSGARRESYPQYEDLVKRLTELGELREFDCMALYASDGTIEMIYGEEVTISDPEPFLASLNKHEEKVAVGLTSSGEKVVMMGVSADYPMKNGEESIALLAGVPASYINDVLSLDAENSLVYSHIIRQNGTYVIRNIDGNQGNYFDRMRETFAELKGKNAEEYVLELKDAIRQRKEYSTVMIMGDEHRHLYCNALPHSEWYLVMIMPYGVLDETVNTLSRHQLIMSLLSCGIILFALSVVFFMYYRLIQEQIKELNAARKEAVQANKAKSEFLSNMSHDIRTPMNAIVGMTAIATANIDNRQQVQNCLRKITLSSKHLLGLINDVLDMSKIESGKMTLNMDQISLREILESIVSIVQPQVKIKKQHFNVFIQDIETEDVYCDSVRLNQVLLNFLSNAIKFTPEGGSIQVYLYEEPSPVSEKHVRVHFRVKDSGMGMSPEFKKKIFESFSREDNTRIRKIEGTGLGMAITKYIVDAMRGSIEVESAQGKGSEFHVTLDLEKAEVREEDMILPNWNMLVVDDDEQLCRTTVASLKKIGINADWTLDGETTLKLVEERHKKHDDYQIILLDWRLPGISGIDTAREIRNLLGENIPILLISAYDWSEIEDDARAAGINGFISKPLFKSTLFYGLKQFTGDANQVNDTDSEESIDFNDKKILLAEDNDINWEVAEDLFSMVGLNLERAENGQICVEKFKSSPVGFYDAILMDIQMPIMTGYQATETIRGLDREDSDIPIIAMTADAFSEDIKRCLDCGMNAHVSKPIDTREVIRLLKKYMK